MIAIDTIRQVAWRFSPGYVLQPFPAERIDAGGRP